MEQVGVRSRRNHKPWTAYHTTHGLIRENFSRRIGDNFFISWCVLRNSKTTVICFAFDFACDIVSPNMAKIRKGYGRTNLNPVKRAPIAYYPMRYDFGSLCAKTDKIFPFDFEH